VIALPNLADVDVRVDPRTAELELGEDFVAEELQVRMLAEARDVYLRPPRQAPPLYHMLNGITPRFQPEPDSSLRFELTSLRGGTVGAEYVKTIGHVHDRAPDGLGYPEAYEVLTGRALFLLFRVANPVAEAGSTRSASALCVLIDVEPGERLLIPPGWHHVTINLGVEAMVFADVVARAVVPDYSLLRSRAGAPLFVGPDGIWRNPRFDSGFVVRLRCSELEQGAGEGLATAFFRDRRSLDYLLERGRYAERWEAFEAVVGSQSRERLEDLPLAPFEA
jgi:glucose-6-phosphate isomerase